MTSSIDSSLAPSSSKVSKVDRQKSQAGETTTIIIKMRSKLSNDVISCKEEGASCPVSETEDALLYLRTLFPVGAFDTSPHHQLPPIVLKHQVYALLPDRTLVDRQLV